MEFDLTASKLLSACVGLRVACVAGRLDQFLAALNQVLPTLERF